MIFKRHLHNIGQFVLPYICEKDGYSDTGCHVYGHYFASDDLINGTSKLLQRDLINVHHVPIPMGSKQMASVIIARVNSDGP